MQTNSSNGQLTAQISMSDHKKSGFDLSNNVLGTGKIGRIIPTRALHVMPGDTIKQDSKVAVQFEPLAVPILANMDVRQEHFYVPYNIVWRNWDKFISSGEKLDYHGVVPNVSMQKIINSILFTMNINGTNVNEFPVYIPLVVSTSDDEYISQVFKFDTSRMINYVDDIINMLDFVGDKFEIKDLLKPQYETCELLVEWLRTTGNVNRTLFVGMANANVSNFIDAFFGETDYQSKYLQTIAPAIKAMAESGDLATTIIPTDSGVEFLSIIYEFFKPLVGIGSNLDYLNMSRITLTDFIYTSINSINILQNNTQADWRVKTTNFTELPMSVLHLRANYNIWYNNYRDILLEANAFEPYDGDDISYDELFVLLIPRQRCWEKDAFTTALDNPGTGNVGVVNTNQFIPTGSTGYPSNSLYQVTKYNDINNDKLLSSDMNNVYEVTFDNGEKWQIPTAYLSGVNEILDTDVQLSPTSGFSLYQLDAAQRAQKWLQKALFFGNRISDFYYMHFGVRFLDARLRLPELLTSSKELVKLDVVMNNTNITTEANGEVYQSIAGDRAAYASAYDNGNSFDRFCEEHGVIMSYLTIMPQITYAYGINRDYSRLDMFDFAFSEFATLGMDAVYDSEITAISVNLPDAGNDVKVFGYQGKYYDYKAKHSEEHGELLDSQDMYTFARKFNMYDPNGRPKLNYEFVHCFPSLDMFVVDSTLADYFRYDIRHSTAAERNLPSQSIYI